MIELTFNITKYTESYYVGSISIKENLIRGIVADGSTEEEVVKDLLDLFSVKVAYDLLKKLGQPLSDLNFANIPVTRKSATPLNPLNIPKARSGPVRKSFNKNINLVPLEQ